MEGIDMNSCITLVSHRFIENQSLGLNKSITPSVTTGLILDLDMDGWMEMGMTPMHNAGGGYGECDGNGSESGINLVKC